MDFSHLNNSIPAFDEAAARRARDQWNSVGKPIGSLGALEDAVVQIAGITGSHEVNLASRCMAVMCSDNGVVAEGVSQTGQEVTSLVLAAKAVAAL